MLTHDEWHSVLGRKEGKKHLMKIQGPLPFVFGTTTAAASSPRDGFLPFSLSHPMRHSDHFVIQQFENKADQILSLPCLIQTLQE